MDRIAPVEDGGDVVFPLPAARWLSEIRVVASRGSTGDRRTGAVESLLVALDGTHDLYAASGSWVRRGIRPAPTAGRPVALFLPPDTPWKAEHGDGRLLLVGSRQPEQPAPATQEERPSTSSAGPYDRAVRLKAAEEQQPESRT